jgi:hypothetical protein
MTLEGYKAQVRLLGLTPCRPSFNRHTLHADGEGKIYRVPGPEYLSPQERADMIGILKTRVLGLMN